MHHSRTCTPACANASTPPSNTSTHGLLQPARFAERDLNQRSQHRRILVQDVSDVFRVIQYRGFDTPAAA